MKKNIKAVCLFLIVGLISFVLTSCSGSNTTEKLSLQKGTYNYMMMDSSRKSLVEGQFTVKDIKLDEQIKQHIVTGTYTVTKMTDDTSYYGFSTLKPGEFKGYYDNTRKTINVNTNPKIADANVFINADVKSGGLIEGGWYYSTFRGTRQEAGLFSASKIK